MQENFSSYESLIYFIQEKISFHFTYLWFALKLKKIIFVYICDNTLGQFVRDSTMSLSLYTCTSRTIYIGATLVQLLIGLIGSGLKCKFVDCWKYHVGVSYLSTSYVK